MPKWNFAWTAASAGTHESSFTGKHSTLVKNSGQLVARGSTPEESIVALLKRIVSQWYTEAEQKAFTGVYGKRALSEEERKTALCLDVIERVKQASE